jgi:phospholipid/cholesterol/gamma-HCH transport system ATP-binding protein
MENGDNIIYMYDGQKEWEGNKNEIIFSKNQRLNDFIFASEFLKDAKDMRMLEETGKISNERNMEELTGEEAPTLIRPPDEEEKNK